MKKAIIKNPLLYIFLGFFVVGAIVAYGFSINAKYKQTLENIAVQENKESDHEAETAAEPAEEIKQGNPFILLLFGISDRLFINDPGRADTIMLALVDADAGSIQLISVPRDAYVDIPGYSKNKLNYAYSRGGAGLLMRTLENWLDIDIYGYVRINFQGFIDLVNLVDGIKVYVPRDMSYDDPADGTSINLKKGEQLLDGKNALDFVRFRLSNDGRHCSDYERMARQQQALTVLSNKLASVKTITRINRIMDILSANVKTSLTVDELDLLIKKYYAVDLQGLETTSLQGGGHLLNGAWYEVVPEEEMERVRAMILELLNELK